MDSPIRHSEMSSLGLLKLNGFSRPRPRLEFPVPSWCGAAECWVAAAVMETILEQQRRYHEERERLMDVMVKEMLTRKSTVRRRSFRSPGVANSPERSRAYPALVLFNAEISW